MAHCTNLLLKEQGLESTFRWEEVMNWKTACHYEEKTLYCEWDEFGDYRGFDLGYDPNPRLWTEEDEAKYPVG